MAKKRLQKSFADYVAIAVCPVLIMLLVGSLVFFLLEVFYSGRYENRLQLILLCFVLASVLIARIGIEQGSEYAGVYGLALAIATSLAIFRLVEDAVVVALCLLAVIWWCSNKLTWDCTLIDDSVDASGEGLLQASGLDEQAPSDAGIEDANTEDTSALQEEAESTLSQKNSKSHAPGMWVVYFSLAALPLFGIGQMGIDADSRSYGFRLLWVYVASALGLLMTTSFLGLRRYLRQRRLTMPVAMAGTWIGMGVALIVGILLVCLILPRPDAEYSLNSFIDKVSSLAVDASQYALGSDDAGKGEGRRVGEDEESDEEQRDLPDEDNAKESKKGDGQGADNGEKQEDAEGEDKPDDAGKGEKQGDGKGEQEDGENAEKQGDKEAGGKKADGEQGEEEGEEEGEADAENENDNAQQPQPSADAADPSESGDWIAKLVKWLIFGIIGLVVLYLLIRNWSRIVDAFQRILQNLRDLWNSLFHRTPGETDRVVDPEAIAPPRPFASFQNPFATGAAQYSSIEELVRYSFDALQSWGAEQGYGRNDGQTPLEFGRALGSRFPKMTREANQVAQFYSRTAYAGQSPGRECVGTLEQLWQKMTTAG
jgi:energy-coupling factor transporter transmembrane protein EcfT